MPKPWPAGCKRCDVKKGDLLDLQNSPQFMVAYYAIPRADAVVVQ